MWLSQSNRLSLLLFYFGKESIKIIVIDWRLGTQYSTFLNWGFIFPCDGKFPIFSKLDLGGTWFGELILFIGQKAFDEV